MGQEMEKSAKIPFHSSKASLLSWLLVLALIFSCFACEKKPTEPTIAKPKKLTILYFNDFHGHLLPFKAKYRDKHASGGVAKMAKLIKEIRAKNKKKAIDTIVLAGGDVVQGTPISTSFEGEAEVKALNAMGLTAMVAGNHDFDFGFDKLLKLTEMAQFHIVSASIYEYNGSKPIFKPYFIKQTINGLRLGLIGLTTKETPMTTHPKNVAVLRFVDPSLAVQAYIEKLAPKTDLLVVLSHVGLKEDKKLARSFPDIDIIVGGHTHTVIEKPLRIGNALICQAGAKGLYLGRLDLEIVGDHVTVLHSELIPITHKIEDDPAVKKIVDGYEKMLNEELQKPLGKVETLLDGERANVRTNETNLGNFVADRMRETTNSDIALLNSGAIRASILPGEINLRDIIHAFPMNNTLVTMRLTGEQVYQVLKRSVNKWASSTPDDLDGGFLQVSGIQIVVNDQGKLQKVKVNGSELSMKNKYKVVTGDFLASGGDGYKELQQGKKIYDTGITFHDLFVTYLNNNRSIDAKVDGRIKLPSRRK